MQPPLVELQYEPLPDLAAALRRALERIISRWRREVRQILPQADALTLQQLENSLPELLEQAANAIGSSTPAPTRRLIEASPVHGTARFHQHFNLNELLIEYAVLRRIVAQELVAECGRLLTVSETVATDEAIDVALRQAAVAYSEHQSAALRIEAAAMTKYLAFLSHDLRGGLNGVMLAIEVLRRDLMNDPKYTSSVEDLDNMRRSMLDTVATMDRFLSAEKLRRGKMPVRIDTVVASDLLNAVVRSLAYQARSTGTPLEVHADNSLEFQTDRELLMMILQNLVNNAIKYGKGKPVELRASRPQGAPPEVASRISVIDRGPGIPQEKLELLFAPYSRVETYGQKGVGLGLFIAQQAADLIRARLWAESTPGQGTQLHVEIPSTPPKPETPEVNNE